MVENTNPVSLGTWKDPDDAPELTSEWFESADTYHGDTLIRKGNTENSVPVPKDYETDEYGFAKGELGWNMLANLRWLAKQPGRPTYVPCGERLGSFLRKVADAWEDSIKKRDNEESVSLRVKIGKIWEDEEQAWADAHAFSFDDHSLRRGELISFLRSKGLIEG